MAHTQLWLAVRHPVITILTSLVISLVHISDIREDIRELRREFNEWHREFNTKIDLLTAKIYELMGSRVMTDTQLYIAVGAPMLFNALLITFLILWGNAKFDAIQARFNDLKDVWRAELLRVEEVLDARLKHLEES
jgi:hypothetical protein